MVLTTRPVHVTVREFIVGGVADFYYVNSKVQRLAGQFVIGIDSDRVGTNFFHRHDHAIIGLKLHTNFNGRTAKCRFGYLMHVIGIPNAVAFFGRNDQVELITRLPAFQPFFHTRNQVVLAVKVIEWFAALA